MNLINENDNSYCIDADLCKKIQLVIDSVWGKGVISDFCIPQKKGMTNASFLVGVQGKTFIIRINGIGTNSLINRRNEAQNYSVIRTLGLSDHVVAIDYDRGYKVTEFIQNIHNCDPRNPKDIKACMTTLHEFHSLQIQVPYSFDLFEEIEFYQSLWKSGNSIHPDYDQVKESVLQLTPYVKMYHGPYCMTHIDAIPDNFLISEKGRVYLIDWEYAAMCDCYVDLAMFSLYSGYTRKEIDNLLSVYFGENESDKYKLLIYCYVAIGGLLWSNWCEYKEDLGVHFGAYAQRQYQYAKEYSMLAHQLIGK